MAKRMLVDSAHPEETRVVVLNGDRLEDFDFETSTKKQIKGNIYLAKVTRVEPSLQAAFVDFGGNRHGFLAFSEIHPDYYRIPVADREQLLAAESRATRTASARVDDDGGEESDAVPPTNGRSAGERNDPDAEDAAPSSESAAVDEPPAEAPSFEAAPHESLAAGNAAPDEATSWAEPPASVEAAGERAAAESDHADETEHGHGPATGERHMVEADSTVETFGGDESDGEAEEERRPRGRSMRHYKIQEVIKRRQIMLVQVTKEERGNKGAALTTYLSLAGRYCVLMPNTPRGGGVSRKITSATDRRRLKELVEDLEVPEGMGVIVRTAGSERSKAEIKRDYEYLLRLWDEIRELTLRSTAPALIYEEGNLIKRSIRDLYTRDLDEVLVDGEEGYRTAKAFMKMLMPSHAKRVQPYRDPMIPLFHRFQVENQIDLIHQPVVQLRSGGYIVISPTEALVSIDVNSGRSTKERNIEETALRTNIEAAEEIARQLRLRDLAGLIVIDFIDMEEHRNQHAVERRLKEAMKNDRARIQLGRISPFGLLEMSRQRLRPSLIEASTQPCPHCAGTGTIRSTESTALHVLRAIEEEGIKRRSAEISVSVPTAIALYILNQKRETLQEIEKRYGFQVLVGRDDSLIPPNFRLERLRAMTAAEAAETAPPALAPLPPIEDEDEEEEATQKETVAGPDEAHEETEEERSRRRRRRRRRSRRGDEPSPTSAAVAGEAPSIPAEEHRIEEGEAQEEGEHAAVPTATAEEDEASAERRRRRRGRRGGRRRARHEGDAPRGDEEAPFAGEAPFAEEAPAVGEAIAGENAIAAERIEIVPNVEPPLAAEQDAVEAAFSEAPMLMAEETIDPSAAPEVEAAPARSAAEEPTAERAEEEPVEAPPEPQSAEPQPANDSAEPAPAEAEPRQEAPAVAAKTITERPANPRRGWWSRTGS